jgi:hypothetical protein
MAASPPIQQTFVTTASLDEVGRYLSGLNVTGWTRTSAPRDSLIWSHRYMSTGVLVVGIILLLTTLIGGLVLLIRETENLIVTLSPLSNGGTRIVVSGAADTWVSSSLFQMLNQLPTTQSAPVASPPGLVLPIINSSQQVDNESYKICPDCAERVRVAAKICRFCKYEFQGGEPESKPRPDLRSDLT